MKLMNRCDTLFIGKDEIALIGHVVIVIELDR